MRKGIVVGVAVAAFGFAWIGQAVRGQAVPPGPDQDGTKLALVRIAGEALLNSHTYQNLEELSDDIGARVTGSPQAEKAIEWSAAKMRAIGLENVHTEKCQLWRGWTRGFANGELLAPVQHPLHIASMGWTVSTAQGGVEGDVVPVNVFDLDEEMKHSSRWAGKILLMERNGTPHLSRNMASVEYRTFFEAAKKANALAVITGQGGSSSAGMNITRTGMLGLAEAVEIPVLSMIMEDQTQLQRYLERGITPRVRLNVQNTFTNGPVESANVVGEIRGTEYPQQIFVVGADLDSWDLSQGATDNGTAVCAVLGAAEAIVRSGQRPRRTLRFVLFTGEEQGVQGSLAYIKDHQAELPNYLGNLMIADGQGPVKEFNLGGRDDVLTEFQPFVNMLQIIRPIEANDKVEIGTDTLPFTIAGLPGINMEQDSPDYKKYTQHSSADALNSVKPEVLAQNAMIVALTAYWVADRPERLAAPWPAIRTEKMLKEQHQEEFLKAIKLWPFDDAE